MTPDEIRAVVSELNATARKMLGDNAAQMRIVEGEIRVGGLVLFDCCTDGARDKTDLKLTLLMEINHRITQLMAFDPDVWSEELGYTEDD